MFFVHQHDQMDCGPACLRMIAKYYGKNISINYLRKETFLTKEGVNLLGINDAAQKIGLDTLPVKISIDELKSNKKSLPCILHWNKNHFVVLYKIKKSRVKNEDVFLIADPAYGLIKVSEKKISSSWLDDNNGFALFFNATNKFYSLKETKERKKYYKIFYNYLKSFKKQLIIMFLLLILGSCLTFVFPFLTQNLIDKGINEKNISIIRLILLAQIVLFIGSVSFEVIRNWLTLLVGTKMSINIITDFLKKMFKLPITFFETKSVGDFNQRVIDNERIEHFLTSQSIITLFSIVTFSVFFVVLFYYDPYILLIYLLLTLIAIAWSFFWLKRRKVLDYFRFQQRSEHQESIYEIINGVTEMKLNQMEDYKTKNWEKIQNKLYKTNLRILKIDQIQSSGFEFINQVKNILVTYFTAILVVKQQTSLGVMLSISYIIGQMNTPINQLVDFFRSLQDAKLSMERLGEVQNYKEEDFGSDISINPKINNSNYNIDREIYLKNISFQYEGSRSPYVLKNINISIPKGKVTAIVGASGSGKTTLMKLLLKFYEPVAGNIFYKGINLKDISAKSLRENCGVVMQDGYIFSDTIERNIACKDEIIKDDKLNNSARIANIKDYIDKSPLGYKKKIGASGNSISGGQRQRILIARAVYKDPNYIFLDEATSALDAENEKIIHDNLQSFFKGKTVVVIAHRLSTVKKADQIIVLNNGEVVEQGIHERLVSIRGSYYNLVKNQLELGA